ncbi:MAG: glycosyltransferase, partial [Dermatophilaceae bacterium]|nr:glycosyltransferase [Dermatophilaceae bacterium]
MPTLPPEPLRVLLMSAVSGVDPHSGDVTYTEQLLASPPPGVEYTTYDRAVAEGTLREVGSRADLTTSLRQRRVGRSTRSLGAAALRRAESRIRRTGRAFREPIRVLEASPTAFDLVHVHVFSTRFVGASPPVVMSAGGPLEWVYGDAWGWPSDRVRNANRFDSGLAAALDATLHARRLGRARRFVAFSHHLRCWMIERGVDGSRIDVVPNYLDPPQTAGPTGPRDRVPRRLGFVAKEFRAKGGPEVVAAFELLRRERPDLELVVIGSPRPAGLSLPESVDWRPFVPRS